MSGRRTAVVLVAVLALSGCVEADMASPACDGGENALVLMAQSVPSAALVPCITALPAGWTLHSNEIKQGGTVMHFGNDAMNQAPGVALTFRESCDVTGAVQVPSDDEAVQRFETVNDVTDGYRGSRFYVFRGGCVTVTFDLRGDGWSAVINDSSTALSFASRAAIEHYVQRSSRGVIEEL